MLGGLDFCLLQGQEEGQEAELLAQDSAKVRARDMTPGASMSSGPGEDWHRGGALLWGSCPHG